jgi:copper(I)-binding protein
MKIRIVTRTAVALIFLASNLVWASEAKTSSIEASGAYIAAVPVTSENTAAYMTLKNPTDHVLKLVGGSSPFARAVEIHKHLHEKGMMKMVHIDALEIPAHGELKLVPMGLHIMLIGLKDNFKKATSAELTLQFSDKTELKVVAPIQARE